jgi:hypothetical protein
LSPKFAFFSIVDLFIIWKPRTEPGIFQVLNSWLR